ncbi:MarR family transcriptional regulator [Desulfovibrio sp. OttesenSCG-928-G15]|nr:MarR family transcriptional regulator [Desulfovibrio sp. OttesenSCG-928-G15]
MACVQSAPLFDARGGVRLESQGLQQGAFCNYGLSALQINVLALIHQAGARVIPYERISRQLERNYALTRSAESVRGVVNRLVARGFIRRKQARDGTIRGVCLTTVEALYCPHIINNHLAVRGDARVGVLPESSAPLSILQEKIDRENLSISSEKDIRTATQKLEALTEDDLAHHWPNLTRAGFSTCQIRQIIFRLTQVNIDTEKILAGLTHAEWELENGSMRDKTGQHVSNPVNWVFSILARQGYYRRPEGYVSPQEQAELDAAEEEKRVGAAHEKHKKAAFNAWLAGLSPEEHASIITPQDGQMRLPEDTALRLHFKSYVLPKILAAHFKKEGNHEI